MKILRKKYGIYIFVFLLFVAGTGIGILNYFYPFSFINKLLFRYNYSIDPDVELDLEKKYEVEFWYPPFLRTIPRVSSNKDEDDRLSFFIRSLETKLASYYPNITLKPVEITFAGWEDKLNKALKEGNPPDLLFFPGYDHLLNREYQLPVERYIAKEKRSEYSTVNWQNIEKTSKHLWIIPAAYQEEIWYGRDQSDWPGGRVSDLISWRNFRDKKVSFNYNNDLFLRQLLTLKGREVEYLERDGFSAKFYNDLYSIFDWLDDLRDHHITEASYSTALRDFFEGKVDILGPVNPWLDYYIEKKGDDFAKIKLKDQINTLGLAVFYKKGEKTNQKIKAAMETGFIISRELGRELEESLNLESVYNMTGDRKNNISSREIYQIIPKKKDEWNKVLSLWSDFWTEELDNDEIRIKLQDKK